MTRAEKEASESRRIHEWLRMFSWVYAEHSPGSDFAGWYSTYDKAPIPVSEMEDWADATARRIRAMGPRRVLEIGVGSGLLLTRLMDEAQEYTGTDFSRPVLDHLAARVAVKETLACQVRLEERLAHDFSGLPRGHFDVVIINSVTQYFPSADYLRRVLAGALEALRPGGVVFVGDVRDLRLHRAFQTGVLAREIEAAPDAAVARKLVDDGVAKDRELLLHPQFFAEFPGAAAVDIRLKRGRFRNEMSAHRYDVMLFRAPAHVIAVHTTSAEVPWHQSGDIAGVAQALRGGGPLRVTAVPNARVWHEIEATRLLDASAPPGEVARVLADGVAGVPDPERFCEMGDALGLETVVTWSHADTPGSLDVTFCVPQPGRYPVATPRGPRPRTLSNDPLW